MELDAKDTCRLINLKVGNNDMNMGSMMMMRTSQCSTYLYFVQSQEGLYLATQSVWLR